MNLKNHKSDSKTKNMLATNSCNHVDENIVYITMQKGENMNSLHLKEEKGIDILRYGKQDWIEILWPSLPISIEMGK